MKLANNAGLREPLMVGGQDRITHRLYPVTRRGLLPPSRILPLQVGMALGQVSPIIHAPFVNNPG
jgi:hypothetical protein